MKRAVVILLVLVAVIIGFVAIKRSREVSKAKPHQPDLISPELHSDNTVTFRFFSTTSSTVTVSVEGSSPIAFKNNGAGNWSATAGPFEPGFYGYEFFVDGKKVIDQANPEQKPNLINPQSMLHIPGPSSLPWEINDVQHGSVKSVQFSSSVVGDSRSFVVYTPPDYDKSTSTNYPVLYLLHGYSDNEQSWTATGRANVILDNLIARGLARPMILVMPLGYGAPEILNRSAPIASDAIKTNYVKFRESLLTEVMPQVETDFRVQKSADATAIAGLSMGGAEALFTGLNNPERFAWVGSFSAARISGGPEKNFPGLTGGRTADFKLVWIACGTDDGLIENNREIRRWLDSQKIPNTGIETPGGHEWRVWRNDLVAFLPLLFKN